MNKLWQLINYPYRGHSHNITWHISPYRWGLWCHMVTPDFDELKMYLIFSAHDKNVDIVHHNMVSLLQNYLEKIFHSSLVRITNMLSWWHHQMETFSMLLALCEGNPLVTGGFPSKEASDTELWCFLDLHLNKRLNKQLRHWDAIKLIMTSLLCLWGVLTTSLSIDQKKK